MAGYKRNIRSTQPSISNNLSLLFPSRIRPGHSLLLERVDKVVHFLAIIVALIICVRPLAWAARSLFWPIGILLGPSLLGPIGVLLGSSLLCPVRVLLGTSLLLVGKQGFFGCFFLPEISMKNEVMSIGQPTVIFTSPFCNQL